MSLILFIDGENFKKKCGEILQASHVEDIDWTRFDFKGLLSSVLEGFKPERKIFYAAKIIRHPQTAEKSEKLIQQQRLLKTHLEKQGFEFLLSGRVRGHEERDPSSGRTLLVFKEKGVDVKLAVDLVTLACDGVLKQAIIGSSDSDLQPAIKELANRGVDTIYLGFELTPNKGLTYTTKRTILIRNSEVLKYYFR